MNNNLVLLIDLVVGVLVIASLWVIYSKAGKPGWAAIIPFYNYYVLLQIVGRPGWWLILMFVPVVNVIVAILVYFDLAKSFGQGSGFGCAMIILPFIFFPVLAFGDYKYQGPAAV